MLPDTPDVEKVCLLIMVSLKALLQKIIIDMSSISPIETKICGQNQSTDCDYADAPVSGGDVGAQMRH